MKPITINIARLTGGSQWGTRYASVMSAKLTYRDWLKNTRKNAGLSQEALGERASLGRTYVNRIERGHIDLPHYETRQRIHAVLGTSDTALRELGILGDDLYRRPVRGMPLSQRDITADIAEFEGMVDTKRVIQEFRASLTANQIALLARMVAELELETLVDPEVMEEEYGPRPADTVEDVTVEDESKRA